MEGAINMKNNKAYCFECKYCIVQGAYAPKECLKTRVNEDSPLVQRATYTEHEIVSRTIDEKTGEPIYTTYGYQYKIFNFKESYLHDNYTMNIKKDYYIVTIQMEKFDQSFSQTKSHVIDTSPIDFFMNERMLYQDEYNVSLLGYYKITRQQYDKASKYTEIYTKEVKERLRRMAKKMREKL